MGCWGMGIMQSDDALDAQIDIHESAGSSWDETNKKKIQKNFINNYESIAETCNKYGDVDNYTTAVYWQVLAYEGMKNGVPFNEEQQNQIIKGITSCHEYQKGLAYPEKAELHEQVKKDYIKDFGEKDWEERESLWGEGSLTNRVIERTQNIAQLLEDFKEFARNGFAPFERKEPGLFETISKKMKM